MWREEEGVEGGGCTQKGVGIGGWERAFVVACSATAPCSLSADLFNLLLFTYRGFVSGTQSE